MPDALFGCWVQQQIMTWNFNKISDFSSYGNHIDSFSSATGLMRSVSINGFFFFLTIHSVPMKGGPDFL